MRDRKTEARAVTLILTLIFIIPITLITIITLITYVITLITRHTVTISTLIAETPDVEQPSPGSTPEGKKKNPRVQGQIAKRSKGNPIIILITLITLITRH